MGSKDLSLKRLESYKDVFADIINVLMYGGKNILTADYLKPAKTNNEYWRNEKMREVIRDTAMSYKKQSYRMSFYGIENQIGTDRFMPIRVMTYDALGYMSQLIDLREASRKRSEKNKKATEENEKKKWKIYPVRTIVLYFGEGQWDTSLSLKDCIENFEGNDYKIDVISISKLPQETIDKFQSDFKLIADYAANGRGNPDYNFPKILLSHPSAVFDFMRSFTDDSTYNLSYNDYEEIEKGGPIYMDDFFKRKVEKGREEGREEGRKEGIEEGREQGIEQGREKNALCMLSDGKLSFEDIAKYSQLSLERIRELAEGVLQVAGK